MENNNKTHKIWNRESILSFTGLILLFFLLSYNPFIKFEIPFETINKVEFFLDWYFHIGPASNILLLIPQLILLILFLFTVYFGIKAIIRTKSGTQKGRMLAIISLAVCILLILVLLFSK